MQWGGVEFYNYIYVTLLNRNLIENCSTCSLDVKNYIQLQYFEKFIIIIYLFNYYLFIKLQVIN